MLDVAVTNADAAQSPSELVSRAAARTLPLMELVQVGEGLQAQGQRAQAAELYKTWIAFNGDHEYVHIAYFNFSVALRTIDDTSGAINALRECLRINPRFEPARINLGCALEAGGSPHLAVAQWEQLVEATPTIAAEGVGHKLMALQHIGRVLEHGESPERAEQALLQAMELRPDKTEAGQHWIALRQRQCKWPVLGQSQFVSLRQLVAAMSPFSLAAFADDPMFQLAKACHYNKAWVGRPDGAPLSLPPRNNRPDALSRLRVGYVSSDLREHAVGFALSEVFELHDRRKIEVFAYYSGPLQPNDQTQRRIMAAVEHWRELDGLDDLTAARTVAEDKIDVLVDLNGYTKYGRTPMFAYRPAPVIVNWCGYPGTMGSPYHHYLITDPQIVPPDKEVYYSEKVLRIPCNQPIDRKRNVAPRTVTRADVGLPQNAFVYACFNGMQKLTDACYQRWMSILAASPTAVLWLLTGDEGTNARLTKAAAEYGLDPRRVIFAQKASNPQHLARIHLADLFLDTFPYGAHSTAADSLTMGLPVLTMPGKSFAARFCSSVVHAAGLKELICSTPEQYIEKAIELAQSPEDMLNYRNRLTQNRQDSVLYDIPGLVRRLEDIYCEIHDAGERGLTPEPDLTNLDIYYEIGIEMLSQKVELTSDESYRSAYIEKLADWNKHLHIPWDRRLWRKSDAKAV